MHNILDGEIKSDANLEGMGTNIMIFKHRTCCMPLLLLPCFLLLWNQIGMGAKHRWPGVVTDD